MPGGWWRERGFWAYGLLQLPDILAAGVVLWLLVRADWLSAGWGLGLFLLWVAKDLACYPLVRGALGAGRTPSHPLLGARGRVQEPLAPRGLVRIGGELWRAEPAGGAARIEAGTLVTVRGVRGLTLSVEPAAAAAADPAGREES